MQQYSTRYENTLLLILFLTFGFVFFDRLALSFLFPFMSEELHLDNAKLGILSSVLALMWAISGTVVGTHSDRKGIRKTYLLISVILFSIFSALSGVVGGFVSLLIFRALMGLAEGPVLPLSQSLMINASAPHRRGLNMGLLQGTSAGLLGAVIGPPIIIGIATAYGWRYVFVLSCIPGLVMAVLIWRYVVEKKVGNSTQKISTATVTPQNNMIFTKRVLLKNRNIFLCILISCVYMTWFIIIITFAPTYLVREKHYSPGTMGVIMSALGVAWMMWGFIVPAISDRIGRKPAMVFFSLLAALSPLALIYIESPALLAIAMLLTYTGLGCFTLFMATIPAESVPHRTVATALGMIMGIGELIGGFFAPTIAGYASDKYGLSFAMWMSATGAICAAVLALFLKESAPIRIGILKVSDDVSIPSVDTPLARPVRF